VSEGRTEKDLLGAMVLPACVLYGIHTMRALLNFNISCRRVNPRLISAYGAVKMAAARMNQEIRPRVETEYNAVIEACQEMIDENLNEHIIVDALQGGAGTSTNMNVNEVIANRALQLLGKAPGDYAVIGPHDIHLHQSTNDTHPTALHVAEIYAVQALAGKCIDGITVNEEGCRRGTVSRMTTLTALVPYLGYEAVERLGDPEVDR